MATKGRPGRYAPLGFQQITDLSSSVGVTVPAAADGRANCLLIRAETSDVRWRDDGTAPTATVGQIVPAGTDSWYEGDISAIRFISAAGLVDVSFYEDSREGQ